MVLALAEVQRLKSNVVRLIAWFTLATFLSAAVPWIFIGWFLHQNSARLYHGAKWHAGMALSVDQGLRSNVLRFFAWFALATYLAAAVPLIHLGWVLLRQNSARTYQCVKWLAVKARWLL